MKHYVEFPRHFIDKIVANKDKQFVEMSFDEIEEIYDALKRKWCSSFVDVDANGRTANYEDY